MVLHENRIKLIIADDHPAIRRGLKDLLSHRKEIELVGIAANGKEALELARNNPPDVVLTDIKMDVMDGRELCKTVRQQFPAVAVIAYTMFDDEAAIAEMKGAGASGFVLKTSDEAELLKAILSVYNGGEYHCSGIRQRIHSLFSSGRLGPSKHEKKQAYNETELKIIKLVCQEFSSKEIAGEIGLSSRAVDHQKERIQEKMGVRGVVGLAVYAVKNWLLYSHILCLVAKEMLS